MVGPERADGIKTYPTSSSLYTEARECGGCTLRVNGNCSKTGEPKVGRDECEFGYLRDTGSKAKAS